MHHDLASLQITLIRGYEYSSAYGSLNQISSQIMETLLNYHGNMSLFT